MNRKLNIAIFFLLILFILKGVFAEEGKDDNDEAKEESSQNALNYNASDFRDPFKSYIPSEKEKVGLTVGNIEVIEKEVVLPQFEVQGVVWGTSLPMAIIDGQILSIGDKIREAKIVEITRDYIALIYEDKRFSIHTTYIGSSDSETPMQEEKNED